MGCKGFYNHTYNWWFIGRYISFGDYDLEPLKIGKKITLTDNSGRTWYVELTDKKTDPP
jgi:hypothetical protein